MHRQALVLSGVIHPSRIVPRTLQRMRLAHRANMLS